MSVLSISEAINISSVYGSELLLPKDQILPGKDRKKLREKTTEGLFLKSHQMYFATDKSNKQELKVDVQLLNTYNVEQCQK